MNGAIGYVTGIINGVDTKIERIIIKFGSKLHELERVTGKFEVFPGAHIFRGMSLDNCIVDVGNTVFSCGQIYVALSRVTSLDGLYIINFDPSNIKAQNTAIKE